MSSRGAKVCLNPDCDGKLKVVGNWCTAGKCKKLRAQVEQDSGSQKLQRECQKPAFSHLNSSSTIEVK